MTGGIYGDLAVTRIAARYEFDVRVTLYSTDKKDWRVIREQTNRKLGTDWNTQYFNDYEVHRRVTFFAGRSKAADKFYQECVEEMMRIFGSGRRFFHGGMA